MATTRPATVTLARVHRDAIFEEIQFIFESACDLPFMLEHAAQNRVDSDDARDLIAHLHVAAGLLDQIGWQRSGEREDYCLELDEGLDEVAARIESFALAALEDNRRGLIASEHEASATVRRLIDADLEKLQAARIIRTAFHDRSSPRTVRDASA